MADACSIQDPQRPIMFGTPLLRIERMARRAAKGPIRLRGKRRTGKAMGKGGTCPLERSIAGRRCGNLRWFRLVSRGRWCLKGRGKFGRAQLCFRELLTQFQPDIPRPLSENLGKLLTPGGVGVPPIHLLLFIFICQGCLKRATSAP